MGCRNCMISAVKKKKIEHVLDTKEKRLKNRGNEEQQKQKVLLCKFKQTNEELSQDKVAMRKLEENRISKSGFYRNGKVNPVLQIHKVTIICNLGLHLGV